MKYPISTKYLLPTSHPNRSGKKLYEPKALVYHYTANYSEGADDIANAKYFGRPAEWDNGRWEESGTDKKFRYGSAHYIVDQDSIQLTIPEDEIAYHVGSSRYTPFARENFKTPNGNVYPNAYCIGIELCVNKDNSWGLTLERAIELGANIIIRNNISMDMVLRHYDVTYKNCPAPFVDFSIKEVDPKWLAFKKRLAQRVEELRQPNKTIFPDVKPNRWSYKGIKIATEAGLFVGDSNGNFNPTTPVTKEMLAVVMARLIKRFEGGK